MGLFGFCKLGSAWAIYNKGVYLCVCVLNVKHTGDAKKTKKKNHLAVCVSLNTLQWWLLLDKLAIVTTYTQRLMA